MKITIHGTGYVGLVTGACLSDIGHDVVCFDINKDKISELLNGDIPFFEPGLEELILSNIGTGSLHFTDSIEKAIKHSNVQMFKYSIRSMHTQANLQTIDYTNTDSQMLNPKHSN